MSKQESKIQLPITADMNIQRVIEQYPAVSDVLIDYGLHCVGCAISQYESIERGARAHGMDDQTFESMMKEINLVVSGHPDYFLNEQGITLSPRAVEMVKVLMKQEQGRVKGLQVKAQPAEQGLKYFLDLASGPQQEEQIIEQDGVMIFVDEYSLRLMKPSIVDFLKTPAMEGFKIIKLTD